MMNKYYSGRNKNGGEEMPDTTSPTVEFISIAKEFRHEYVVEKSRFITPYIHVVPKRMHNLLSPVSTKSFGMLGIIVRALH